MRGYTLPTGAPSPYAAAGIPCATTGGYLGNTRLPQIADKGFCAAFWRLDCQRVLRQEKHTGCAGLSHLRAPGSGAQRCLESGARTWLRTRRTRARGSAAKTKERFLSTVHKRGACRSSRTCAPRQQRAPLVQLAQYTVDNTHNCSTLAGRELPCFLNVSGGRRCWRCYSTTWNQHGRFPSFLSRVFLCMPHATPARKTAPALAHCQTLAWKILNRLGHFFTDACRNFTDVCCKFIHS
jgi:hypothetical protein